ncbi:12133_t:CDS:2, partial [Dentiscutata heterogama]
VDETVEDVVDKAGDCVMDKTVNCVVDKTVDGIADKIGVVGKYSNHSVFEGINSCLRFPGKLVSSVGGGETVSGGDAVSVGIFGDGAVSVGISGDAVSIEIFGGSDVSVGG